MFSAWWRRRKARRRTARGPYVEPLEDRSLPSGNALSLARLPLTFEPNRGQAVAGVDFVARGAGFGVSLAPGGAVLRLQQGTTVGQTLTLSLVGADAHARAAGVNPLPGKTNYFIGNDSSRWLSNVATYGKVQYHNAYPGVDVVYYGNQGSLEYDFIVAPHANPGAIKLAFAGMTGQALNAQGDLVLHTNSGDVVEHAPVLFQTVNGVRQAVSGRYVLVADGTVRLSVGAYDHSRPLVIDPVLTYATYLGGSGTESISDIAVDSQGNIYVTGFTTSVDFPTKNPIQGGNGGVGSVYVSKINAAGTGLVYSTYLGGSNYNLAIGLALDPAGNAYLTGVTMSSDFPLKNPLQSTLSGLFDGFILKLNATGSALTYSTYLGGRDSEFGQGIAVDAQGNAFVTGFTTSDNFPTRNALQPRRAGSQDAFVVKLNNTGTALLYSTYLGGRDDDNSQGIAIDAQDNVYLIGSTASTDFPTANPLQAKNAGNGDVFVTKINNAGTALLSSTYLGGGDEDDGQAIALDAQNNAYITGSTASVDFPTKNPIQATSGSGTDVFIAKVSASGTALGYSTYLGGGGEDRPTAIAVDGSGNAVVTGATQSTSFPTVVPLQANPGGGTDGFVTKVNAAGSAFTYSTYLGGSDEDSGQSVTVDSTGLVYVAGSTQSTDFPTKNPLQPANAGQYDAFIAKLYEPPIPHFRITVGAATAGTALPVTVTALDPSNNVMPSYIGTVHFTSSDPGAVLPNDYNFSGPDQGTHTFSVTFKTAGTQTFTATDTVNVSVTGAATVSVSPGPAAALTVSGYLVALPAGASQDVTVTLLDASRNVATGYRGTVHWTSSDPRAGLPADYTFTAADAGIHTFTAAITLKTAGTQTFTATDKASASLTGGGSTSIAPGPAASFGVTGFPSPAVAGTVHDLIVTARDAFGNVANTYTGTVHLSSSDAQAALAGDYTFTLDDGGAHAFNGLIFKTAGSQTLTVTDTAGASVTGSQPVTVTAAAASRLALTGLPASVSAGAATDLTVTVRDPYGNLALGYTGAVHLASTDSGAVLPADYTFSAADAGVHVFKGLVLKTAGGQTVTATDKAIAQLTSTQSTTVTVAVQVLALSGLPAAVTAGAPVDVTVAARDNLGNLAAGYVGTVHFASTDGQALLPADYTFTAADGGIHLFHGVVLKTAGGQALTVSDTVSATLKGTQTTTVNAAAASRLILSGLPGTTAAGAAVDVTVAVQDAFGNAATSYFGRVHFTSTDPQAVLPADYTFTAADAGVHVFKGIVLKTAGSQSLTAVDTANSALTATQNTTVTTHASVLVVGGLPGSLTAGASVDVTVSAQDAFGNVVAGYTGTVHITSTDGRAVLPADYAFTAADAGTHTFHAIVFATAGNQSVTVTDTADATLKTTQAMTIVPAAADRLDVTGLPAASNVGSAYDLAVAVRDAFGNVVTGYTGTLHVTSSDARAVLPADYTFTAADAGAHTFRGVTLATTGNQTVALADTVDSHLAVTLATTVSADVSALELTGLPDVLTAGSAVDVTVSARDPSGNLAAGYVGTVHFTSTDGQTLLPADYTFTTADGGTHTFHGVTLKTAGGWTLGVVDTADAGLKANRDVTVTAAAASRLRLSGFPAATAAGDAHDLTVAVQDAYGNAVTGYSGTLHLTSGDPAAVLPADYTFTAGDAGSHTFHGIVLRTAGLQTVSAIDQANASLTASVTTTVSVTASVLVLDGLPGALTAGAAVDLTVSVRDASGNLAAGYIGTVHFTSTDGRGVLPADYTFTAADAGSHTFHGVVLKTAGPATVSVVDTNNGALKASGTVTITAAAASQIVLTGFPVSTTAGDTHDVTVSLLDTYGNVAAGYTGTVHFTSDDPQAILPADYSFTAADAGTHTFHGVVLKTAGPGTLTAANTAPGGSRVSSPVIVRPAAASHLVLSALPAATTAGVAGDLVLTVRDAFGNVASGYTGTVHLSSSDAQAFLPADYTFTATDAGTHTFPGGVTFRTAGSQSLTAADTATPVLASVLPNLAVAPATASVLELSGLPATTATGATLALTVTARDAFGNRATGYRDTLHLSSTDTQALLPADYTFTADDQGSHTFNGLVLRTAGMQAVTATDTVQESLTSTRAGITVVASPVVLEPSGFPATTTAGATHDLAVTARDAFGNVATRYAGTVHFASNDGKAVLPADYTFTAADQGVHVFPGITLSTAGTQTLHVTDRATSSLRAETTVTVAPAAAATLIVTGLPATATAGQGLDVTVTAFDVFGNVATGYTGKVHFTSDDAQALLPVDYAFTAADAGVHRFAGAALRTAGSHSLVLTDTVSAGLAARQSVSVSAAGAARLEVTNLPSGIVAGQAVGFTVTAVDAFGNVATGYRSTVRVTGSDPLVPPPADYTFTATDAGRHAFAGFVFKTAGKQTWTLTDRSAAGLSAAATVPVTPTAAQSLTVTGFPSPTAAGAAHAVTVTAVDAFGNVAAGYTGTVHFTSGDPKAVLPADYAFTAADVGRHVFAGVKLFSAGTWAVNVRDRANAALAGKQAGIALTSAVGSASGSSFGDAFATSDPTVAGPPDLRVLDKLQFLNSGTPTIDPDAVAKAYYVDGLYRNLLGRPVDPSGLLTWVRALRTGSTTLDVVRVVWNSAEHRLLEADRLYQAILHRKADPGGRASLANALIAGLSETAAARRLLASAEYQNTHADPASYVNRLYGDLLGRAATADEVLAGLRALQGTRSRDQLAQAVLTSSEACGRLIDRAYAATLRRAAAAADRKVCVTLLQAGRATPQSVYEAMLTCGEYWALTTGKAH